MGIPRGSAARSGNRPRGNDVDARAAPSTDVAAMTRWTSRVRSAGDALRHRDRGLLARTVFVALFAACSDEPSSPTGNAAEIIDASVVAGPHNVLSAVVHVRVRGAHEVAVVYTPDGVTNG